tara:strand:- start:12 stop:494 length:483 start_codon:yes stop_codon:yes gene_type:complete
MIEETVKEIIQEPLYHLGYKIIRIKCGLNKKNDLQIMTERIVDEKLDIEDCVKINRHVSALLEVDPRIKTEFILEISSPGINRPLVEKEDYKKFSGNLVSVKLNESIEGRRKFKGKIISLSENNLVCFMVEEEEVYVPFYSIHECKLQYDINSNKTKRSN